MYNTSDKPANRCATIYFETQLTDLRSLIKKMRLADLVPHQEKEKKEAMFRQRIRKPDFPHSCNKTINTCFLKVQKALAAICCETISQFIWVFSVEKCSNNDFLRKISVVFSSSGSFRLPVYISGPFFSCFLKIRKDQQRKQ